MQTRRKHNRLCPVVRSRSNVPCVQCHAGLRTFFLENIRVETCVCRAQIAFYEVLGLDQVFFLSRSNLDAMPCPQAMRIINYSTCMMRILGEPRFDANRITSDFQIRQQMMQTSIDCLLMRRRLLYIVESLLVDVMFFVSCSASLPPGG